jgi:GAF domain-containing protein
MSRASIHLPDVALGEGRRRTLETESDRGPALKGHAMAGSNDSRERDFDVLNDEITLLERVMAAASGVARRLTQDEVDAVLGHSGRGPRRFWYSRVDSPAGTMSLEPLPETREALRNMARWWGRDLTAELVHQGELVQEVVPSLVGMSLARVREGLTFTLAATQEHLALLDGIQYAVGGPCVDAALEDSTVLSGDSDRGLLDEQRWVQFARAGAAHGVLSTLSMPIHVDGRVVGGMNLYAATPNAFAGTEERVARIVGGWAQGAVHNADLSFSTRVQARRAPQVLDEMAVLDQASGVVVAAHAVDEARARQIITEAARRAGQVELEVARELVRPFLGEHHAR